MINYHDEAIKALIEEYRSRFINIIMHYCTCRREYERKSELLYIIDIKDDIEKCISDKRPCDLGKVRVDIIKKLFKSEVYVLLNNKRLSVDEFKNLVIALESFMEWYRSDCSIDALMSPLIGADFFEKVKDLLKDNLDLLNNVCEGGSSSIDINNIINNLNRYKLPDYVIKGFINALLSVQHNSRA